MNCLICTKHNKFSPFEIYRNDYIVISHGPLESNLLGYLYLEPITHVENWHELDKETWDEITTAIPMIEALLKKELAAERVYSVTISEAVRHLHFHLIPRSKDQDKYGLDLIEQATQQKIDQQGPVLLLTEITDFIQTAKNYFQLK